MHALEFNQEGIAMFATRQRNLKKVWHGLGDIVNDESTVEDLLKAAGLWEHKIVKSALFADYSGDLAELLKMSSEDLQKMDRNTILSLVTRAVKNSDLTELGVLINRENDRKHLSIMSPSYCQVQLMEAYGVLDTLVDDGQLILESAGSLRGGKSTFLSAKLTGDSLQIVDGDLMDQYVTMLDSYDGFSRLHILAAGIMVVCLNTFRAALGEAERSGKISSRSHRSGMFGATHLDEIREALGLVREQFTSYQTLAQKMAMIKVSEADAEQFFEALVLGEKFGTQLEQDAEGKWSWSGQARRSIGELEYMYHYGPGQELDGRKGTAWGLINGVTGWTSHLKKHRSSWDEDRTTFQLIGNGNAINERAHHLLVQQYQLAA